MSLTIDFVKDQGDNSLQIIGHDGDVVYESGMGRKSDLPEKESEQLAYYKQILEASIPPTQEVLYQTPEYAAKVEALEVEAAQKLEEKSLDEETPEK